ncbi:MAG: hypothetical protein QM820_33525 [Minicystis sp.]
MIRRSIAIGLPQRGLAEMAGGAWLLRRALAVVAAKDRGAFRNAVFEDSSRHRPAVRLARAVHRVLGKGHLSSVLVAGYGLKSFLAVTPPARRAPIVTVAAYANEKRQFADLGAVLGREALAAIAIDNRALVRRAAWGALREAIAHPRTVRRAYRIVRRINRREGFLVACRLASTLGYFLRFARMLPAAGARAVLVSSDSNPYAMGIRAAAKRHGMAALYVTHGHIPDGPPRLDFDLSILDGPAVLEVYEESGPVAGAVVFKGAEGRYAPMRTAGLRKERIALGVFLSLITDWPRLARLLAEIHRDLRPARLILRFHPNELVRPRNALALLGDLPGIEVSYGERVLLDDAARCDLVIAANSSCHLTALKSGVPTVHLHGLDAVPHDFYRFLRHRMVFACERVVDIDPARIAAFYEDPDWARRFAFFDASYPGLDCRPAVRAAIAALVPGVG